MNTSTFLTKLVGTRRLQPEPVATLLLTHLLQQSPQARNAVEILASELHPEGQFEGLDFSAEASLAGGDGRPDIVGATAAGVPLLIEAKLDAGLTAAQSGSGYLGGLSGNGLLLFLVPEDRIATIWPKILQGPAAVPQAEVPTSAVLLASGARRHATSLPDGRRIGVVSWQELLERLSPILAATDHISDLQQLNGLISSRVSTSWVPVLSDDLDARSGRQLHGLRDVLLTAASAVSGGRVKNGTNDWGPARWITTDAGERLFWAGIRIPAWGSHGLSPLWAVVVNHDPVARATAKKALSGLNTEGGPGVFELDLVTLGVPLVVPPGAELDEVKTSLVRQLTVLKDLLSTEGVASEDDSPTGTTPAVVVDPAP